jgi:hypothetical protein
MKKENDHLMLPGSSVGRESMKKNVKDFMILVAL